MPATITSSSLPALSSPRVQKLNLSELPNRYSAYHMVLRAEQHAIDQRDMNHMMFARIVGYLLLEFHERRLIFGDTPRSTLDKWITSMPQEANENEHDVVYRLGMRLRDDFIRLCMFIEISS